MSTKKSGWREDLLARYPAMFGAGPGIRSGYPECGDGWSDLVETAVGRLADIVRERPGTGLTIGQIKSKNGTLRLYTSGTYALHDNTRSRVDLAVDLAEARSGTTCEVCGAEGSLYDDSGWFATACSDHAKGDQVSGRDDRMNLVVVRALRHGRLTIVSCRRYVRETDSFEDVDPATVALEE